jgi:hypothetical protein
MSVAYVRVRHYHSIDVLNTLASGGLFMGQMFFLEYRVKRD